MQRNTNFTCSNRNMLLSKLNRQNRNYRSKMCLKQILCLLLTILSLPKQTSTTEHEFCSADSKIDCDKSKFVKPECEVLNWQKLKTQSDQSWNSYAVIVSKGRLGNHVIAFTLIGALAKELGFKPFITEETYNFLSPYFSNVGDTIPVLEWSFCNWKDIPFEEFEGDLDELLEKNELRQGRFLDLWPRGYLPESTVCCPAEDLQKFVTNNYYQEAREALTLKQKFQDYASDLKRQAAEKIGAEAEDVTFVGIHNRRTDYLDYMKWRFGDTKNPYNKRYFREAMEYFREDNDDGLVIFFYVSDDMEWGRKNVKNKHGDLYFVGSGNTSDPDAIGKDLAVLASCHHSITTWGSFSMWAAFLAGGEYYSQYGVIVPKHIQEPDKKKKKKKKKS